MSMAGTTVERARTRVTTDGLRMGAFYVVTVAFLGFLLLALSEPLRFSYLAWTPGHEFPIHRVHHVMIGGILGLLVLAVAAQLYRPAERVGAFLLAATLVGAVLVVELIATGPAALAEYAIFAIPLVLIGLFHPGLRSMVVSRTRVDRRVLAVAAVGAIPLAVFTAYQLSLQVTLADEHVMFGHYAMMATGMLAIAVGAMLASLRPAGWRALAYGVAALAIVVGIASVAFPDPVQGANPGVVGGLLVIVWAVVYLAVAERSTPTPRVTD